MAHVDVKPVAVGSVLPQLEEQWAAGEPISVRLNGLIEFRIQDEATFQQVVQLVDRLETIEAVRDAIKDVEEGRLRALDEVVAEKRRRYGV